MSPLIWDIVLLLFVQQSLCAFDANVPQGSRQSGSFLLDTANRKIDSEHVIVDNKKTSKEDSSAYNKGEAGFNGAKENRKSFDDQDTTRKEYDKGRHSLGESEAVDQGKNSFEQHGGGSYKKGHHKTGFSNNYHKQESGNNSSFYEDSDDEKGHRSAENSGGYYGQKSQDSFRDGLRDASLTERDRIHQGKYDNRENYDAYRGYSGGRNNNRYNDDRRNYLQDEMERYYGKNGKETYYNREKFYPVDHRAKPTFGYSRYHVDALPRSYHREDFYGIPRSRDYRYFPNHERYYDRDIYYPDREYNDRDFRSDLYGGYRRF